MCVGLLCRPIIVLPDCTSFVMRLCECEMGTPFYVDLSQVFRLLFNRCNAKSSDAIEDVYCDYFPSRL